ncbi:helix-turn-helix domain-containing protein [Subtercola sp. YIM 133946]|uniref:helix-turn-helix domain-containing protein n=1 Tax=Subtercola sp. YIM 133946 TaxID=3118909 RepID=UPI002F9269A6
MPALNERATEALSGEAAAAVARQLPGIRSALAKRELPDEAVEAVADLLQRLAEGHAVVVASTDALLTTSQAAELIGISATYLLRQANNGVIPVEYRGTHRRFRLADAMRYLEESKRAAAARAAAATPEPGPTQ